MDGSTNKANILIIEDEAFDAENLKLQLQQAGHRIVDVVSTGEAAIARAEQGGIDLMLVDIVLIGEIDGIETVRRIHEKQNIPAIFITSHTSDELLMRAEQVRPFAYLLKPHQQRELELVINMCIARARVERKLTAEKEAAESELRNAYAIIQHTNEGIMLTDNENVIISVNPAFSQITGYSASEVIGQKSSILRSDKHEPAFYSDMWSMINLHGHWQGEIWNRHKNGKIYPEWLTINSIYDENGIQSYYAGIFSDITVFKHSESENERLLRELSQTHKMQALGQLTSGIAHDFNNILAIIMGYIELALRGQGSEMPEKMLNQLKTALSASERARELIAQMMIFSRSDSGVEYPLQIWPLVTDNIKMLSSILPSSIKIELNSEKGLPKILMDEAKLQQLLMNLCINAKDAMEGVGTLSINLGWHRDIDVECSCCHKQVKGDWIELSVSDTGSGMTAETLIHIFEPFYTTKEVGKGAGMGMSVLHGIVTGHKGHVLVETEPGKGTIFRLLFPPLLGEIAESSLAAADKGLEDIPQGSGGNILVLDDEPMLTEYIGELLELNGYQVTAKTDSYEALSLFRENPDKFDLLITDQTMPGLTGMELIKTLKEIRPEFPVILSSGYGDNIDAAEARKMGICYLNKPIDSDKLFQSIAEMLV